MQVNNAVFLRKTLSVNKRTIDIEKVWKDLQTRRIISPRVRLQEPKGSSGADGLADGGHPAEAAHREDPDLPVDQRQRAGASETGGAPQEGAYKTTAGDVRAHAGQWRRTGALCRDQFWQSERMKKLCCQLPIPAVRHHCVSSFSLPLRLDSRPPRGSAVGRSRMLAGLSGAVRWRPWKGNRRRNRLWRTLSRHS